LSKDVEGVMAEGDDVGRVEIETDIRGTDPLADLEENVQGIAEIVVVPGLE
jgi:hypothetical protein